MIARTFSLSFMLLTLAAHAAEPPCTAGAQRIAGTCEFPCTQDADCRHENVCVVSAERGHCEPRLPIRSSGAPATIRRGDATHAERFKETQPIPPGFHLAREPHWEMVARGALAFVSAWIPIASIGLASQRPLMAIPLAGPFLGFRADHDALVISGLVFDFAVQLAGVGMVIAGFARPAKWLERDGLSVVPTAPGAPVGASLLGRF